MSFFRICFADLENASDLDKALALSGSELKGIHFKVEKAEAKPQKAKQNGTSPVGKPKQTADAGTVCRMLSFQCDQCDERGQFNCEKKICTAQN